MLPVFGELDSGCNVAVTARYILLVAGVAAAAATAVADLSLVDARLIAKSCGEA